MENIEIHSLQNNGAEIICSLPSGITGGLSYIIKNGWCIVRIYNVGGNGNNPVNISTNELPKAALWCHLQFSTSKAVYLNPNSSGYSTLTLAGSDNINIYGNLVFPIAADSKIK